MLMPEDMTRAIHELKQKDIEPMMEIISPEEYQRRKREEFTAYIENLPQVCAWLAELGRQPGDVAGIRINSSVTRDTEREEAEKSKWAYWKPGKLKTVTLTLTDSQVYARDFDRLDYTGGA